MVRAVKRSEPEKIGILLTKYPELKKYRDVTNKNLLHLAVRFSSAETFR